jgi:hypothetical protein
MGKKYLSFNDFETLLETLNIDAKKTLAKLKQKYYKDSLM